LSAPSLDDLIRRTRELEAAVPAVAGAFPDFARLAAAGEGTRVRSVYLLGTIKSGKSTLVNALLGRDVMPRGAGVKTFNLTRARHRAAPASRVVFRTGEQLAAQLAFDFRLLGVAARVPPAPYDPASVAPLEATLERFETLCREDDRLQALDADPSLFGLLPLALARVRRTIAGLVQLHAAHDAGTVARIAEAAQLRYDGDAFDGYLDWTASPDLGALIREIELGLPFPEGLPQNLELVDCQGSDSLNPLDFADVESVVQQADRIVYVVQSRLGLRQGDRYLLSHLADVGAAPRLLAVFNVEAFDALAPDEFDALLERARADVHRNARAEVPLLAVNSLAELDAALGETDELDLMRRLWDKREARGVLERLDADGAGLRRALATLAAAREDGDDAELRAALAHRARRIAEALLERDRRVLGTESGGVPHAEAVQAVQRIVEGERVRVRADATAAVDAHFADEGPLRSEIDDFLSLGAVRYARQRPVPEALLAETRPGVIVEAAIGTFNEDWLHAEGSERASHLGTLRRSLGERMVGGVRRVLTMLPEAVPDAVLGAGDADDGVEVRADPERAVGRFAEARPLPPVIRPVSLSRTVRHTLGAEFRSRGLLSGSRGLVQRVRRRGDDHDAADELAQRVEALWRRTLAAAFREAAEEAPHDLASARENAKFQYFHRLAEDLFGALAKELTDELERHRAALASLAGEERLLLDDVGRERMQAYVDALG
jgi:hypothetical protein